MSDAQDTGATSPPIAAIFCTQDTVAPGECICCGGFIHAGDEPAFEAPEGSLVSGWYCSEQCWDEWETECLRLKAWRDSDFCETCGFDNHEHQPGCEVAP